jgi:hypothetical protein
MCSCSRAKAALEILTMQLDGRPGESVYQNTKNLARWTAGTG